MQRDNNKLYFVKMKEFSLPADEAIEKFAVSNSLDRLMHFIKMINGGNRPVLFHEFSDTESISCSEDAYNYFLSKMEKGIYCGNISAYNMLMYMAKLV